MTSPLRKSFHLPESREHFPRGKDFHTEHAKIELTIDFQRKSVEGSCTLTIVPMRAGLESIELDACEMQIARVEVDGTECSFDYDNERLTIKAGKISPKRHTVRVMYSATPRDGIYFIGPDEKYPGKPLQAWTHGEAEFARYWYPCYDYPNDKCTTETVITVPKEFNVISNGELISRKEEGQRVTFHWREDRPHSSYLTSFVAGVFGELKEVAEDVPLLYFFPEGRRDDVKRYFGETPRMIRVYNEVTGVKYPYSKYAQTAVEDFIFGGMENIDATTLTTNRFHDAGSDEDFQGSYAAPNRNAVNLVAHELAHQWFGDLVTCADWSHAWLNEGFADYMQVLYIERTRGVDTARWDMQTKAQDTFDEDDEDYRRPIVERDFVFADDMFDNTTYEKGAWMIHELRYIMGDEAFFRGINEYLKRFSFRNADTADFRKVMEEVSGLALERFFLQAFYTGGYPELDVGYSWDAASSSATVTVRQTQSGAGGAPVYVLPCDVVFYTKNGREKKRVGLSGAEQSFSFQLASEPSIVEIDPEEWLLKKVTFRRSLRLITNQLEHSEDASSRAAAARELGGLRAPQAVGSLEAKARNDGFWYVQASAIKALGELGTQEALKALLSLGMPENRRVRRALAEALGNFKAGEAVSALRGMLRTDASPYVRCEAALSLSKSAGRDAFQDLAEAMKSPSPNETLGEACLAAMGKLNTDQVRSLILKSIEYGNPTRVRIGALKAIRERGRILDAELGPLKNILLKDKEYSVRDYLAGKLIPAVSDARMLETLLESSRTDRDNRVRRSSLEAYHGISSGEDVARTLEKLKSEVEALKEARKADSRRDAGP